MLLVTHRRALVALLSICALVSIVASAASGRAAVALSFFGLAALVLGLHGLTGWPALSRAALISSLAASTGACVLLLSGYVA
jgi:hypothetical protein